MGFICGDRPWPNSISVGKIIVLSIYKITGVNLVHLALTLVYGLLKMLMGYTWYSPSKTSQYEHLDASIPV